LNAQFAALSVATDKMGGAERKGQNGSAWGMGKNGFAWASNGILHASRYLQLQRTRLFLTSCAGEAVLAHAPGKAALTRLWMKIGG